ncbi:Hsp70 family protein [Schaedlerella arabinosiphila]|uniref:Chaperone protein DnaK n=1 Tax=Schaedlerella arabinosiphila TaxID=2044587 RepID=A0A9X5H572_9FIRM|nr:Hsp70 family protein [Schaedlerella arabinosiphila]KAI4440561.1 Chaperone protein DnaK [Schaedlerella arabinosiphila]MCI9603439.1 Hsp70 family protein [Ruminococcus sp.]NDO69577.1 Hsp70 family protein [Schaedlerella arabinosiphila]
MGANTIIGIDLGTSTTEAAVIRDGKPMMIVNFDGQVITPSAAGVDKEGQFVFGEKAKAQYLLAPEDTVIEAKRKIGTKETLRMGKKEYSPVEISAMLLKYVREYVSESLGEDISRAVISVPAYFDDLQRQETVEAGKRAGFSVERIINEPTAASLSYGISHMDEESHILVYDLGGGTFDVTLLEMFGGVVEVKASSGDNRLGGKDFDECLIQWLLSQFRKKNGKDLSKDPAAMVKLKEQAEWCKKELSVRDSCQIVIPFIAEKNGNPLALEETVTAEQFEEMTRELVERTHAPIDVVLADSGVMAAEIDRILLVGGSTRMPMIRRDIEAYLHTEPSKAVNPDYAVAEGAAIQAGIIEGSLSREEGIIMTDVNPYTLGIRVLCDDKSHYMSIVIPRNVTIPVVRKSIYYTSYDNQDAAKIEVYQGEHDDVRLNHFLGEFVISGIPMRPEGEERIEVEFSYNLNGMLEVSARIPSSGEEASVEINMMEYEQEFFTEAATDVTKWKESSLAKEYRTVIRRAERRLKNEKVQNMPFYKDDLESCLYDLKLALIEEDQDRAEELEEDILDMLEEME